MGWWKNTYFWIAIILTVIGIIGLARGNQAIADPGQDVHPMLAWLYLLAAVIMVINGVLSHRQYIRDHAQHQSDKAAKLTEKQEG